MLSLSFFLCPALLQPSFPVSFYFILLFDHGYFLQLLVLSSMFSFSGFPSFAFPFFRWFSVSSFALANKTFALHFFFSLVLFDLNWFLTFKKTIFLFKQ